MTEKQNHNAVLVDAATAFAQDGDVTALQNVYRTIPAAARAKAQIAALRACPEKAGDMLDAFLDMPASPGSRVQKPQVSDDQKQSIRDYITSLLDVAADSTWAPEQKDAYDVAIGRVQKYISTMTVGAGKTDHDRDLSSVVNPGDQLTANLKGQTFTASVDDDLNIVVGKQTFTSLSAAAGKVCGRNQDGWTFWRLNGVTLHKVAANQ